MTHKHPTNTNLSLISGYELIHDTKEFLDENYHGCFVCHPVDYITRSIFVSVDGYANFLKIIFKAVFASHLISIKIESNNKNLTYDIKFDLKQLTDINRADLLDIADKSGFSIEMCEDMIRVKFDYTGPNFTVFQSVSTRTVYNSLKSIFLS